MPVYNLLEYSDNYSMTSGSLWKYYRDKTNDFWQLQVEKKQDSNK